MYEVVIKKKIVKKATTLPKEIFQKFRQLVEEIKVQGPVRSNWSNYGILKGTNTHHCHLSLKWVACWVETEQGIQVEATYVGSRESAPYAKN